MKMYTSRDQTAKLIELGFEKPNMALVKAESLCQSGTDLVWRTTNYEQNYSIGELIEMLPKTYDSEGLSIGWHYMADVWIVRYPKRILIHKESLVDALYEMILRLKEEGVI